MGFDLLIKDGFLVMPESGVTKATLAINGEKIVGIFEDASHLQAKEMIDARGKYVLPGVVQPHCHLGKLSGLQDYAIDTASAAIGGVTTVIDFFRGEDVSDRVEQAGRLSYIDFSFHFQIMSNQDLENIHHYVNDLGISSFKFNMAYKGEESKERGMLELNDGLMVAALLEIEKIKGTVACVHAENGEIIAYHTQRLKSLGRDDLKAWSEARPSFSEAESVHRALYFGRLTQCPLYFVHLTTQEGLRLIKEHRERGLSKVYVETCPQYLTHHVNLNLGRSLKFNPPLRTEADNKALWQGVFQGDIDTIGIDHVPRRADPEDVSIWKRGTFPRESATLLPMLISEGLYRRGLSIEKIVRMTSCNAARVFNLYPRKGALNIGSDADVVVVDLDVEKKVTKEMLKCYSNVSVYEGWSLKGWPVVTLSRGKVIMRDGEIVGRQGWGKFLERRPAN